MVLWVGAVAITGLMLLLYEHEKGAAAQTAAAQRSEADASVWAVEGEGNEITNIPPGGVAPVNIATTNLPAS